jgi:TetR/AcrR family transcriptional regulator
MREPEYERDEHGENVVEGSDSRLRIVRVAYPLFVEQGYDAVSMQAIADSVPLNKATLYHHFQSKDELFLAVVRMALSHLYRQIEGFIAEGGSAADQLTRAATQHFQDSQSEFGALMTDVRRHLPHELQQSLAERCSDPWNLYEQIFTEAVAAGELPAVDPTLAATMFAGLIQGQTWALKLGRIDPPLDEARARLMVETLFAGLNAVGANQRFESLAAVD